MKNSKTGGANNNTKVGIAMKGLDGQAYLIDTTHLQKIQIETAKTDTSDFARVASSDTPVNSTNFFEYQGFMAVEDNINDFSQELRVSIDWNDNIACDCETILVTTVIAPLNQSE